MSGVQTLDLRGAPDQDLTSVVSHLRSDGLVAYPTETVYGLGGACTPAAIGRVQRLKGRDDDKPLLVLVSGPEDVASLHWNEDARALAEIFWPGSVTLVLADPQEVFPPGVRSPEGAVGVRVSPHPVTRRLLEAFGAPLTSTSLNRTGEPPVSSGAQARELLSEMGALDAVLLDGGALPASGPSTVVDCTGKTPTVLREGVIPVGRLRCVLPEIHGIRID
ncbi:MAG: L-threonylcarbamoyladenylate synthase [Gemmatimonadota bacterium]|nr:L-threonylcarbamoyladenylate synthase [Gemmatimonadota bacterium]